MTFTTRQIEALLRPIKPRRVMQAQGQSHVPAYDVVAHLTRIFGFAGWDKEIRSIDLVEERNDIPNKTGWYVTYRCLMRLTIRDPEGNVMKVIEDGATGSAQNMPGLGDAHDFAYKNAISYAVKRCAKDLGDQYGLSLYNKGSTVGLVGTTLVGYTSTTDPEDHAPVPLSLGNDERQIDVSTGEIVGGGDAAIPPAAPPASTVRRPPGTAAAEADTRKAGASGTTSSTGSSQDDQPGEALTPSPATIPPAALSGLLAMAARKGLDDTALEAMAKKPLTGLTEAESIALTQQVVKFKPEHAS